MEHRVIFRDPAHYASFPRVRRMGNGDLLLAYYDTLESSYARHPEIHHHYQFGAKNVVLRSRDEGETWERSPADEWPDGWCESDVVHQKDPEVHEEPSAPLWHFSAELRDGTVLQGGGRLVWSKNPDDLRRDPALADAPVRFSPQSEWYYAREYGFVAHCRFVDGAWQKVSTPFQVPPYVRPAWSWVYPMEMADGSLVAIMAGKRPDIANVDQGWEGVHFAARSDDGGYTWKPLGAIGPQRLGTDLDHSWQLTEANAVVTARGRIVAVFRVDGTNNDVWQGQGLWHQEMFIYQSTSDDGGRTWTPVRKTPMWGHPAHLTVLPDGRLVCVFGYRRHPFGIQAVISEDEGETWDYDSVRILRTDGAARDLGYPNSVVLKDGRVFTTYYFTKADGIRHIAATIWDPGAATGSRSTRSTSVSAFESLP